MLYHSGTKQQDDNQEIKRINLQLQTAFFEKDQALAQQLLLRDQLTSEQNEAAFIQRTLNNQIRDKIN